MAEASSDYAIAHYCGQIARDKKHTVTWEWHDQESPSFIAEGDVMVSPPVTVAKVRAAVVRAVARKGGTVHPDAVAVIHRGALDNA
jgi:hypothetical protein